MSRTVWYPGHMARGTRKLAELAGKLDLIIEVRDSRAPVSTSAPFAESLKRMCPVVLVLSKKDLTEPEKLRLWLSELGAFAVDLRKKDGLAGVRKALEKFRPAHRELRLAVVGIPNVGKSMLLNALVKKSSATVGGIPGITRSVSWYRSDGMLIVDSPGILDPHAEPGAHLVLSWLSCAKAEVVGGWESAAVELLRFLSSRGMSHLVPVESVSDEVPEITLEKIGRRMGCLMSGGRVNFELAGRRFVEAFSSGRLGPVCLELPGEGPAVKFHEDPDFVQ